MSRVHYIACMCPALILMVTVASLSIGCDKSASQEQVTVQVEHGDEAIAKAYYTETFKALGLPSDVNHNEPGMAVMLTFLGYKDLTPQSLESDPSADLMKHYGDDLLASAFFAPKITDVSQEPSKINVGCPETHAPGSNNWTSQLSTNSWTSSQNYLRGNVAISINVTHNNRKETHHARRSQTRRAGKRKDRGKIPRHPENSG